MEIFVELHRQLLNEEHETEIEECTTNKKTLPVSEMQTRGICLSKLHIISMKTGLYGRTITKLGLRGSDRPLPSNNFSSGDIVDIHLKHTADLGKPELQGVVTSVRDAQISIALDGDDSRSKVDELNNSDQSLIMFKTANEVTHKRLQKGLDRLSHHSGPSLSLIDVCFGQAKPTSFKHGFKVQKYYNAALNLSQKDAIEFALMQRELAVIHGPPGTGKTTTIVELITQLVITGQKVLTCAPSNVAVDNILEKLSKVQIVKLSSTNSSPSSIKIVRLGHPARILSTELHHLTLDAMIARSDAASIVRDVRRDIDELHSKFRKKHNKQERVKFREEKKLLMKELKEREKKSICEILTSADVVLATNVGAHCHGPLKNLPESHFQIVVIDECGQALEASCWIPMLQAPKCILAGDHLQLPPTVKSTSAALKGLSKTLLERVVGIHGKDVVRMLNIQYRMNQNIMNWSSDNLYESKLKAHESVEKHLLHELPGVSETEDTLIPLLLIDTAGCDMPELQTQDNESIGNPGEANIVASHVCMLVEAGVNPKDIAVISPYNMQVDLLRKLLREKYPGLEIRSVDGFQGREKEAVVLSLVRSNDKRIVGFLSDDRRTNVAVTRARRHLALICDSLTVGKHPFLKTLIDYMNEHGEVRSAHDFANIETVEGNEFQFDASAFIHAPLKKKNDKTNEQKNSEKKEKQDLSKLKEEYSKILLEFRRSLENSVEKITREFSSNLKSYERLVIHELCEEMGLKHESTGQGKDRKIIVSAICEDVDSNIPQKDVTLDKLSDSEEERSTSQYDMQQQENDNSMLKEENKYDMVAPQVPVKEITSANDSPQSQSTREQDYTCCPNCGRKLPQDNIELHQIHCEKLKGMKAKLQNMKQTQAKVKTKKPPKTNKRKNKEKDKPILNNDDELLDDAIRTSKLCSHDNCQVSIALIGQTCRSCGKIFCLEHQLPELHGCGAAAHASARQQISRDGILYRGSGVPTKNLPAHKHAHLQRKLESQLKEMKQKRKVTAKTK